ncbi:TraR/DksA family transcriptional regulator [Yersinia enterocolitica]|uniref:TraR/DksA family transcriptional regulator n=1 Tax=Yersinia enterocolitica TaxID=630 RepID=UPI000D87C09C|nr:TraR/DksA family transcriptional regulator [Yersinia enterocolitica]SQA35834.1 Zinc-finger containing protein [Yersinia enterocolitica]SUP63134.1 Zinc-finger containing protein [Yersinia enterocolitica]
MADSMDIIQEHQLATLERQIAAARITLVGVSALFCEDCDQPIPEARRAALQGIQFCVSCQQIREQLNQHYRR